MYVEINNETIRNYLSEGNENLIIDIIELILGISFKSIINNK